jgi:four helix bundle protein
MFGVRGSGFAVRRSQFSGVVRGSTFLHSSSRTGDAVSPYFTTEEQETGVIRRGIRPALLGRMQRGADRVENIRAWQLTYKFKLSIYRLLRESLIATQFTLRDQLQDSAASAVSQIEEGFARFYPKDNGRMVVNAKASLKECVGHLRDAVDRGLIDERVFTEHEALAASALREIAGYVDYLQSPEAETNARRIRERRMERRRKRLESSEPRTENSEPETKNSERRTSKRTRNKNQEPGTGNPER